RPGPCRPPSARPGPRAGRERPRDAAHPDPASARARTAGAPARRVDRWVELPDRPVLPGPPARHRERRLHRPRAAQRVRGRPRSTEPARARRVEGAAVHVAPDLRSPRLGRRPGAPGARAQRLRLESGPQMPETGTWEPDCGAVGTARPGFAPGKGSVRVAQQYVKGVP